MTSVTPADPESADAGPWELPASPAAGIHTQRLAGLGFNQAAPEAVLLRLLEHDRDVLDFLWRTDLLPARVIEAALAQPSWQVRGHLLETFATLSPRQWAGLLEGPTAETRRRRLIVELCAERGIHLPGDLAERTTHDPSPPVRAAAADLPGVSAARLATLTADPEPMVRAAAAPHAWATLDDAGRQALLADAAPRVRAAALLRLHQDDPMPVAVLDELTGSERSISGACALSPESFQRLTEHDPSLRRTLADNPHLSAGQIATLATDTDPWVRLRISVRPGLTEAQRTAIPLGISELTNSRTLPWVAALHHDQAAMRRLAHSCHPFIRRSVARAPHLPADVVAHLARDPDRAVHLFLAESCHDATPDVLLSVAAWWSGSLSHVDRPRSHPNFPRNGLLRFADEPNPLLRRLALDDPASDADLAEMFASDPDEMVRSRAAADPRLSSRTLERLLEDPDMRSIAAHNPAVPPRRLIELLCDAGTARAAAANPSIPLTVMHRMIDDAEAAEPLSP